METERDLLNKNTKKQLVDMILRERQSNNRSMEFSYAFEQAIQEQLGMLMGMVNNNLSSTYPDWVSNCGMNTFKRLDTAIQREQKLFSQQKAEV